LVAQLRRHPLARALRVDKGTLAALQATLLHYLRGEAEREIPVWRMIAAVPDVLAARAGEWAAALQGEGIPTDVVAATSTVGGGSLPGETLPTHALSLVCSDLDGLAARLRAGQPPVVVRIAEGRVLLDPRTVAPGADEALLGALRAAWQETAVRKDAVP
jgi:L-seryl-tRNA(Ser) seleniumtransferase